MLGDGRGREGRAQAKQGGLVARRGHHHGACRSRALPLAPHEIGHLDAALAHQGRDHHVGLGAAHDGPEQAALARAGFGEEPHALPPPERHAGVEDAHARGEGRVDGQTAQRVGRRAVQGARHGRPDEGPPAVANLPQAIDHASEEAVAARDLQGLGHPAHRVVGAQRPTVAQGQEHGPVFVKGHHLGPQRLARRPRHPNHLPHPRPGQQGREAHAPRRHEPPLHPSIEGGRRHRQPEPTTQRIQRVFHGRILLRPAHPVGAIRAGPLVAGPGTP
jgi:hypothetical protein